MSTKKPALVEDVQLRDKYHNEWVHGLQYRVKRAGKWGPWRDVFTSGPDSRKPWKGAVVK